MPTNYRALLDEKAAAAFLGVSEKTLQGWRWLRRGPRYLKLGRAVRYSEDDLQAFVASCRIDPVAQVA